VTDATSGVAVDLHTATEKVLIFRKGNGDTAQVDATFATDGSNGVLTYTFVDGDLDKPGAWQVQASAGGAATPYVIGG
jgi:hypothetical protein